MRFIIDNQLPLTLARWLSKKDVHAEHVLDLKLERASDSEIWDLAAAQDTIVVSKDVDFFLLAHRPGESGQLLWVRVGNCRTSHLLTRFEAAWPSVKVAFEAGQRIVELR